MAKRKTVSILRRTIEVSIHEGIYAQLYFALCSVGSVFVGKLAVLLQATPLHFSLLVAIGQSSQLFQALGVIISRRLSHRKGTTIITAAAGRSLTFLTGFVIFLFPPEVAIWVLLCILAVSAALQTTSANLWIAWTSDMIPERIRGRFFSRRNQILMFWGFVTGHICGILVDFFDEPVPPLARWIKGYLPFADRLTIESMPWILAGIFVVGTALSLWGLRILGRQPERPKQPDHRPSAEILLEPFSNPWFRRLLLFGAWWGLTTGIGAGFWLPFMLKNLGMSALEVVLYGTLSSISMMLALPWWGRMIDRYGNGAVMKFCVILGGVNPAVWLLLSRDSYWLIWIEALSSGVMWGASNLIATNFMLSLAPRKKVQAYSAVYASVSGVAMMTSTMLSGVFFPDPVALSWITLQAEQVLFALTAVARLTTLIPLHFVRERRSVPLRLAMAQTMQRILYRMRFWRRYQQ